MPGDIVRFEDIELDVRRYSLQRSGRSQKLERIPMELLLLLVERQGQLVTREDIIEKLWGKDVFLDTDNSINTAIRKIRQALRDDPDRPRFVQTVAGKGYRFIAPVEEVKSAPGNGAPPSGLSEPAQPDHRPVDLATLKTDETTDKKEDRGVADKGEPRLGSPSVPANMRSFPASGKLVLAATLILIAISAGAIARYLWRKPASPATAADVKSLAVLPFKPLVEASGDEVLEMGMADTLVMKLSSIGEIAVRPIASVRNYKDPSVNPVSIGHDLGVDAVLDGSIQHVGERVRVTVRLMRVSDGRQLWSGTFNQQFNDIFAVQDSISEDVVAELSLKMTSHERELLSKRYTANTEAYELYSKGSFFWNKRTRESTQRAIQYFQQALDRDPDYALAYVGLAECFQVMPIMGDVRSTEAFPKAKQAALKALELDPHLAEAHASLGYIKYFFDWDWEGARKEYERALQLNPNSPTAHWGYAILLSCIGEHQRALSEIDEAQRLDPLSLLVGALKGQLLWHAHRYTDSESALQKTLEVDPTFWVAQIIIGKTFQTQGRTADAIDAFQKAGTLAGGISEADSLLAYTYAVSGHSEEATKLAQAMQAASKQRYVPPYNIAMIYNGLGNNTESLSWLDRAYKEKDVHMVFLLVDPKWDRLRSDPGFVALTTRMNLP